MAQHEIESSSTTEGLHEKVGRLPVLSADPRPRLVGIVTRSDLIEAHAVRVQRATRVERTFRLGRA